jgi:hypothetical protein
MVVIDELSLSGMASMPKRKAHKKLIINAGITTQINLKTEKGVKNTGNRIRLHIIMVGTRSIKRAMSLEDMAVPNSSLKTERGLRRSEESSPFRIFLDIEFVTEFHTKAFIIRNDMKYHTICSSA